MKSVLVLGSTGSIGTQTLDVIRAAPESFRVAGLAMGTSVDALVQQVEEFHPPLVAVAGSEAAAEAKARLPRTVEVLEGPDALAELCRRADYQVAVHGVVGGAGLPASVAVLERGLDLALANKESLVMAGKQLMELARRHGGEILPVDSELCALFQCMRGEDQKRIRRIHLTASGGPFRDTPPAELEHVTPEQAVRHPNWSMGPRISVGSATLMNKALEVIEVHHLFGLQPDSIHVVQHRQSVVHSMVEFVDGSVIAQLGPPDMRGPIHYCLHHPDRAPAGLQGFDFGLYRELNFEEPDPERFPSLALGFRCIEEGSDAGSVLNAADEVAVEAFLEGRIPFREIHRANEAMLDARPGMDQDIDALLAADQHARQATRDWIATRHGALRTRA